MRKPVIEFSNFTFQYKVQQKPTLHDINLTIYENEKVLILGASGSGKTTLANCINGIVPFSYTGTITGSCKVNGVDTSTLSIFELSKSVGTVLQDSDAQFVGLSVGEDIAFAMENDNIPRGEMIPRVLSQSQKVGMERFLDALPFYLSGGQKQKVTMAGVLDDTANILIFDEPLASLDPFTGTTAIELIDDICTKYERTVIIIEHRLEDVLHRPIDRIIVMDSGRIVSDTTPVELLKKDTLQTYGIREPLYITAMKYAGCDLESMGSIESISSIDIKGENREKLLSFFSEETVKTDKEMKREILKLENVCYTYERNTDDVVRDISFSVTQGEKIAVIGKNGAGKSTVARLICGVGRPRVGEIYIDETDYESFTIKEIGEKIGYVMQNPNQMLVKDIIKDEVELALNIRGLDRQEVEERTKNALNICELYRMRNWPVDAVSYGQKKRVTIADILALEPDILILDEPSAGQDYRHYMDIIGFINKLSETYEKTIIFITHDMHLAIENTNRAIVFSEGEIVADDDVFSILSNDEVIKKANLKQTSLYILAVRLGLEPKKVIERYILHERSMREIE